MLDWKVENIELINTISQTFLINIENNITIFVPGPCVMTLQKSTIESISTTSEVNAKTIVYSKTLHNLKRCRDYMTITGCNEKELYIQYSDDEIDYITITADT